MGESAADSKPKTGGASQDQNRQKGKLAPKEWPTDGSRPTFITFDLNAREPIFNALTEAERRLQRDEWLSMSREQQRQIAQERGERPSRAEKAKWMRALSMAEANAREAAAREAETAGLVTAAVKGEAPPAQRPAMAPVGADARVAAASDRTSLGEVRTALKPATATAT